MEIVREYRIINEKGMHARASAKFVEVVEGHGSAVEVNRDGLTAFGNSIMGLLMLAASKGTVIEARISGPDADKLADALDELIANRFGERF